MKYCDPLGGQNIILPLGKFWNSKKETVMVTARLDVASLFDGIAPGAMASVTGIVTLLTTAYLFKNMLPTDYDGMSHNLVNPQYQFLLLQTFLVHFYLSLLNYEGINEFILLSCSFKHSIFIKKRLAFNEGVNIKNKELHD